MEPILLDIPESFATERLTMRIPCPGDGAAVAASVRASVTELMRWMPWATDAYSVEDGEVWCRRAHGDFFTRKMIHFLIHDADGRHAGNVGAFKFDWTLRSCEIGYWLRTDLVGRGLMSEAVVGLVALLRASAGMRRIQLVCDASNERSAAVARRAGFALEGTLRADSLGVDGSRRDTHIFARVDGGGTD